VSENEKKNYTEASRTAVAQAVEVRGSGIGVVESEAEIEN
jgi:hypothetical protein